MKIKVNGVSLEGEVSEVTTLLRKLGLKPDEGLYYSQSKNEYLLIAEMDTTHIKNAAAKMFREWCTRESSQEIFLALLNELVERTDSF